jgi:hypothetical protein
MISLVLFFRKPGVTATSNAARAPKPPDRHPYHLASLPPPEPPSKAIGDREEERALNSNAGELVGTQGTFFPNFGTSMGADVGADMSVGVWEGEGEVDQPTLLRPRSVRQGTR